MSYDRTCDSTEEWSFLNYHSETLKKPDPSWRFSRVELYEIAIIYFKLQKDAGCELKQELPIKNFSNVLHKAFGLADDMLIERIFSALDSITSTVPLKNWIMAMSLFLRGSLQKKIDFCFKVYDISGKNEIRREHMVSLLRKFVFKHQDEDVDEAVKDLVDIIIKKVDHDKDGIISFDDYSRTVLEEPLMLECFGQCLPDRKHVYAFLITFTDKINKF
jgi:Ca2+-binding EF-hand superfamily protein